MKPPITINGINGIDGIEWAVCYAQAMRECNYRDGARFRARLKDLLAAARSQA